MALMISPRTTIQLDTRRGNAVVNFQAQWGAANAPVRDAAYRKQYSGAIFRLGPSPYYNCHGMTFAGRRTAIEESQQVMAVLADDDYEEIPRERVLPGDVVVYYANDGDLEHSGVVIEPPSQANLWIPTVCSKWGALSEVIHAGNDCPYFFGGARYYRVQR
jgi:hypothetical protein